LPRAASRTAGINAGVCAPRSGTTTETVAITEPFAPRKRRGVFSCGGIDCQWLRHF
jgi:hypothetical protein